MGQLNTHLDALSCMQIGGQKKCKYTCNMKNYMLVAPWSLNTTFPCSNCLILYIYLYIYNDRHKLDFRNI